MADADKDILITPSVGGTNEPTIQFTGFDNAPITLRVLDDGTVSFEGTSGQLFSISDDLTGTIFAVNDISGVPSIEVDASGIVRMAEFSGEVIIGGKCTALLFDTTSDFNLKDDIEILQPRDASGIEAKSFVFKSDRENLRIGYIAQEVAEVLPSTVSADPDGNLKVNYQEVHTAKIAELEAKVEEQGKQIEMLLQAVEDLKNSDK